MSNRLECNPETHAFDGYAPISSAAVFSAIAASASVIVLQIPELVLIPATALVAGLVAGRSVKTYDLRGRVLAVYGVVVSVLLGATGVVRHVVLYHSEALPAHARIEFDDLSETSRERWLGSDVCLKGYADGRTDFDRAIVLSRNGKSNRPADRVLVLIDEPWDWRSGGLAVSGRLELNPAAETESTAPRFVLRNAVIRASHTRYRIATAEHHC